MIHCIRSSSVLLLTVIMIAGCAGSADDLPEVVPVSGTVMYNGEAVSGATVSFWAEGAPRAATGVTGPDGKFQLSMFGANDGAMPGENTITVTKVEGGAAAPRSGPPTSAPSAEEMMNMTRNFTENAGGENGPKSLVPEIYGSQDTTTLKETVSADGNNTFVLQLVD